MPRRIRKTSIILSEIEWNMCLTRLQELGKAVTAGDVHKEQLALRAWMHEMLQDAYEMGREDARND